MKIIKLLFFTFLLCGDLFAQKISSFASASNLTGANLLGIQGGVTLQFPGSLFMPSGVVSVANGGTGLSSYSAGDLIRATGTTTLSKLAKGTSLQYLRMNSGATDIEWATPITNPLTSTGDFFISSDNSGTPGRLAAVASGSYMRSAGVSTLPVWSTLLLPNSATANYIVFANATNQYSESVNLQFNGTTLTTTELSFSNSSINSTAGDAATINSPTGRFRKDTSGTTFTLTNSFITANSFILLTAASDLSVTGNVFSVVAGSGSAVITFWTAGVGSAAPTANQDINFWVVR